MGNSSIFRKIRNLFSSKIFLGLTFLLLVAGATGVYYSLDKVSKKEQVDTAKKQQAQQNQQTEQSKVLGSNTQIPQIYISGGKQGYSSGGLIALASTDEPAVIIGGYNISGDAEKTMYQANEGALLDYLTHDKDGKQTKKNPDVRDRKST